MLLSLSLSEQHRAHTGLNEISFWHILQQQSLLALTFHVVGNNINVVLELYFKTASQNLTMLSDWGPQIEGSFQWKDSVVGAPLCVIGHVVWKPQWLKDSWYKADSCKLWIVKRPDDFAGHAVCPRLYAPYLHILLFNMKKVWLWQQW